MKKKEIIHRLLLHLKSQGLLNESKVKEFYSKVQLHESKNDEVYFYKVSLMIEGYSPKTFKYVNNNIKGVFGFYGRLDNSAMADAIRLYCEDLPNENNKNYLWGGLTTIVNIKRVNAKISMFDFDASYGMLIPKDLNFTITPKTKD